MVERLGEMRKGRRERIEKGIRERIEKRERVFFLSRSGPAMQPLFLQVLRVRQVGPQASKCGFYTLKECIIKKICHGVKQNAKICAIDETECNETILGGQRRERKDGGEG